MLNTRSLLVTFTALALAPSFAAPSAPAAAKTWIVDNDGGPGVHFLNIHPAVVAASDGDLIRVRDGNYSYFIVDKALTIIGESQDVTVVGRVQVLPAPGTVSLASMQMEGLDVIGCTQTVILDEVTVSDKQKLYTPAVDSSVAVIEDSSDVRFIESTIEGRPGYMHHALLVQDSRVEIASSSIRGAAGAFNWLCSSAAGDGGWGGDGLRVEGDSRVQASRSSFLGGEGGSASCGFLQYGGSGGSAAVVNAPSEIIVTGGTFTGGEGGSTADFCGDGGDGIDGTGQMRRSGAEWVRGLGGFGYFQSGQCANGVAVAIPNTIATPDDPTLERLDTPVFGFFGGPVKLRIYGEPGVKTRLLLGTQTQVAPPNPVTSIERLVVPLVSIDLGKLPRSGFVTYTLPLGGPDLPKSALYADRVIVAQGSLAYPGNEIRRTNSAPLVLR